MILKTYSRAFTNDAEATAAALTRLRGRDPHLRFRFGGWDLIGIGGTFIVDGTGEALAPITNSHRPYIVNDLAATQATVESDGATITQMASDAPTGRMLCARHADRLVVKYVDWTTELVETFIRSPQRDGRLSSEL